MTITPGTHTPAAYQAGPPNTGQLMAELVTWLTHMPAQRRALIASALAKNRWNPALVDVCRQAVDELIAAAGKQAIPHPYEYVAKQLGVADDIVGQPITGDPAEHMRRLVRKLSPDGDSDAQPAVQDVAEAAEPAPRTGADH